MATGSYIDIDFEADGQNFQRINIDGTDYFFRTKWNSAHEFFIVFIYDTERNFLYAGRLVYGQTFPAYNVRGVGFSVTPFNLRTPDNQTITRENLGNEIKLYLEYEL